MSYYQHKEQTMIYVTNHAIKRASQRNLPWPTAFSSWCAKTWGTRLGGHKPIYRYNGQCWVFTRDMQTLVTVYDANQPPMPVWKVAGIIGVSAIAGWCMFGAMLANADDIQTIHTSTLERITYKRYAGCDWNLVRLGQKAEGNCCTFAYTNWITSMEHGYTAELKGCRARLGENHAYVQVGEWALDNRFARVIPMSEQDCK